MDKEIEERLVRIEELLLNLLDAVIRMNRRLDVVCGHDPDRHRGRSPLRS